jgi:hypothetical protein
MDEEAQLEEMFWAMLVLPPSFLLHGLHSFYTNANAFLFQVAPNWVNEPLYKVFLSRFEELIYFWDHLLIKYIISVVDSLNRYFLPYHLIDSRQMTVDSQSTVDDSPQFGNTRHASKPFLKK